MKIGFDLDSVLNLLGEEWAEWIAERDPGFTLESIKSWDTYRHTVIGKQCYDYLHLPGVFRRVAVREGAREALRRLADAGHELFVVTSAIPSTWADKVAWLAEHFPFIPDKNLIATHRKGLVRVDMLVDDGLHNFAEFRGRCVVFDQPWNRTGASRRMARVRTFAELERLIAKMGGPVLCN